MQVLSFILNLLIFLVSLCVLICLHELGHLSIAKLFKVYCYEYSIGMGPLIYKKKSKKGETQFSIRALPIGGYVAMAGEEDSDKDRTNAEVASVPKERTVSGVSWWKQVLIFIAGVTVNFILGFIFFFISYTCCPQNNMASNQVKVTENSKLISEENGIKSGDVIRITSIKQGIVREGQSEIIIGEGDIKTDSYTDISNTLQLSFIPSDKRSEYAPKDEKDYKNIYFTATIGDKEVNIEVRVDAKVTHVDELGVKEYAWDTIGFTVTTHYLGFLEGTKQAFIAWGEGTVALFKAIGMLFTPQGWSNVGGIISVFQLSEQATSMGAAVFFNYWGLISVNLAIFNLLPIPGLDGWQILVAVIEGAFRKKIPSKVKSIVSMIGLGLLFLLMAILIIKDIIGLFTCGLLWMI